MVSTTPFRKPQSRQRPPPSRRRDKPQLSCTPCRIKKRRCDRRAPCGRCARIGDTSNCVYVPFRPNGTAREQSAVSLDPGITVAARGAPLAAFLNGQAGGVIRGRDSPTNPARNWARAVPEALERTDGAVMGRERLRDADINGMASKVSFADLFADKLRSKTMFAAPTQPRSSDRSGPKTSTQLGVPAKYEQDSKGQVYHSIFKFPI
ncbi:uncharacterized protein THITE_2132143 [Thermothielavioides terrestris NRRL 8126]|uniref:Zn(2)-C6 fungal-type domain-containing protein n=1 Tax=Thermothielavioides terrestris (strain ATCC 38088 / NRRL 8126) TaxID=578455 RepID=G2RD05_THETT|nr:uncharacterized protein THITE_2132143 [Thermothielavioides terrestris NRRL 8126]AEO70698.1 hypothetical protein THITE_2132143 [Thermothielavioides terrestris NRRL 8126]